MNELDKSDKKMRLGIILISVLICIDILARVFLDRLWLMFPPRMTPEKLLFGGIPLWGLLLGSIFSLIPRRGTTYKERFVPTVLMTSIIVALLFLLLIIYIIINPPALPSNMPDVNS